MSLKIKKIEVYWANSDPETYKVVKLTSSELVIELSETEDTGAYYYNKFTFKKEK